MTLVVRAPCRYAAERRYVYDVVLTERLGLRWRFEEHEHPDVRIPELRTVAARSSRCPTSCSRRTRTAG
jgi:hypothetical protein